MIRDGKTYIWIPSALTLNRLTAFTAAVINAVHSTIGKPLVSAGEVNPYYLDLNDLDMGGAPFTRDATPGMAYCGPIANLGYLSLDYISLIVAMGQAANAIESQSTGSPSSLFGEVEGLPVWFEFDAPDSSCPLDPGKTWREWGQGAANDEPSQRNGKWYRSSSDYSLSENSGRPIDASVWTGLRAAGSLVVLTLAEYTAIPTESE